MVAQKMDTLITLRGLKHRQDKVCRLHTIERIVSNYELKFITFLETRNRQEELPGWQFSIKQWTPKRRRRQSASCSPPSIDVTDRTLLSFSSHTIPSSSSSPTKPLPPLLPFTFSTGALVCSSWASLASSQLSPELENNDKTISLLSHVTFCSILRISTVRLTYSYSSKFLLQYTISHSPPPTSISSSEPPETHSRSKLYTTTPYKRPSSDSLTN